MVEWVDQTAAVQSEREIDNVVDAFLQGDLKQRIAEEGKTGFYQLMAKKINVMISGTSDVVDDVQDIVAGAGRGDLSRRVQVEGKSGLTAKLGNDVNGLVDTIGTVVEEVQGLVAAANQGDLTRRIETEGKPGLLAKIGGGINELTDNMAGAGFAGEAGGLRGQPRRRRDQPGQCEPLAAHRGAGLVAWKRPPPRWKR